MRKIIIILIVLLSAGLAYASSQPEMNKEAYEEFAKVETEMKEVLNEIENVYRADREFLVQLRKTQKAWGKFRNTHLDALFPKEDKQGEYGTVYTMCYWMQMRAITHDRIKQLRVWLEGTDDGDVCSGSVKTKTAIKKKAIR